MSLAKHCADFFMRHVLRRRRLQDNQRQVSESKPHDEVSTTLRTYAPGGDPFDDRIEFHLRKGPGGFSDPP